MLCIALETYVPPFHFDNKYDRQLRLWGAAGQKALAEAHVLLLGAGPAGTETLKNLVLPGVGRFTVVDDATVTFERPPPSYAAPPLSSSPFVSSCASAHPSPRPSRVSRASPYPS